MIRIIYNDASFLVLEKKAGMPSQPDRTGDADVLTSVQEQFVGSQLGLVHRLDRPVSGVMVLARGTSALTELNEQFRGRKVQKIYRAIVEGKWPTECTLRNVLLHDGKGRKARVLTAEGSDGPVSELHVLPLASGDRFTLLELRPEGGAFHQIRAQLAAAGSPIKGDVKYGARRGEKDRSIGLHAYRIEFLHPETKEKLSFTCSTPETSIWKALEAMINA